MADKKSLLPGFRWDAQSIALITGTVAVITLGLKGYDFLLNLKAENSPMVKQIVVRMDSDALKNQEQDLRLDRTDRDRERFNQNVKELTNKTSDLTAAVIKLTTVMEGNTITKKAEYVVPMPVSPTRQAVAMEVVR